MRKVPEHLPQSDTGRGPLPHPNTEHRSEPAGGRNRPTDVPARRFPGPGHVRPVACSAARHRIPLETWSGDLLGDHSRRRARAPRPPSRQDPSTPAPVTVRASVDQRAHPRHECRPSRARSSTPARGRRASRASSCRGRSPTHCDQRVRQARGESDPRRHRRRRAPRTLRALRACTRRSCPAPSSGSACARDVDQVIMNHPARRPHRRRHPLDEPVRVHDKWAFAHTTVPRFFQRVLHQPMPGGVGFQPVQLDGEPCRLAPPRAARSPATGGSWRSRHPGHTPGHVGSYASTTRAEARPLRRRRDRRARPAARAAARRGGAQAEGPRQALGRILDHDAVHPTVFLPSHDPGSAARE